MHHFICGIHDISESPIVYSFGNTANNEFELALLQYRPEAKIYAIESSSSHFPATFKRDSRIRHGVIKRPTLGKIMHALKHTYVDILKVELSGNEWEFLSHSYFNLSQVGQLILHLHAESTYYEPYSLPNLSPALAISQLIGGMIETAGLRAYHREFSVNRNHSAYFYFIQRNWTAFDRFKLGMASTLSVQDAYDLELEYRDDLYYISQYRERDKIIWKVYNLYLMSANPDFPCIHVSTFSRLY